MSTQAVDPVVQEAMTYLSFDPDVTDVDRKLRSIAAVYFNIAQRKANTDLQVSEANLQVKQRRENLYVRLREEKAEKKYSEREIEAIIAADEPANALTRRLMGLEVASRLQNELLCALRMSNENLQIVGKNMGNERFIASRT